jgi:hypothetical protein
MSPGCRVGGEAGRRKKQQRGGEAQDRANVLERVLGERNETGAASFAELGFQEYESIERMRGITRRLLPGREVGGHLAPAEQPQILSRIQSSHWTGDPPCQLI